MKEDVCKRCFLHDKDCAYELRQLFDKCSTYEHLELKIAAEELVDAVEKYVEPKSGTPYMHRTTLLTIKNNLKKLL